MEYLPLISTVAFLNLLAVISPGPDFAMTVRNSLCYSRRSGIFTSLGISLGISRGISLGFSLGFSLGLSRQSIY